MSATDPDAQLIEAAILDDAYEEAQEWGMVRWHPSSRIDPGYWTSEIDLELTYERSRTEHDEETLMVVALAKIGRSVVFHRRYDVDPGVGELLGWEDV